MTTSPTVSVVLPAFDAAAHLAGAIASIRHQIYADWELLVVDDGSTDGTPGLVAEAIRHDRRIRLLTLPHRGLVAALNAGVEQARGRFIARMDADDVSLPERLARQVEFLRLHPEIGLASSLIAFGGDAQRSEGFARHVAWLNGLVSPDAIALNRFVESPVAHPSVLFRRELLDRHGGYREGPFPEDYELWLRWLAAGVRFGKVPEPLLIWQDRADRLSRSDPRYGVERFYEVKAPYLAQALRQTLQGRALWVWGAGRVSRRRLRFLEAQGLRPAGFVDVAKRKWGRQRDGRWVIGPESLPGPREALVLAAVAKRGAREWIRQALLERGFSEGQDFWCVA